MKAQLYVRIMNKIRELHGTRTLTIQPTQTVSKFELICLLEMCNECVLIHSGIEVQFIDLFARGVCFLLYFAVCY